MYDLVEALTLDCGCVSLPWKRTRGQLRVTPDPTSGQQSSSRPTRTKVRRLRRWNRKSRSKSCPVVGPGIELDSDPEEEDNKQYMYMCRPTRYKSR